MDLGVYKRCRKLHGGLPRRVAAREVTILRPQQSRVGHDVGRGTADIRISSSMSCAEQGI